MRTSMAYFLGAGTVVAAIGAGLGGGLLIANIVHPATPKQGTETTLMERRTQPAAIQATTTTPPIQPTTATPEPVPYLVPQSTTAVGAAPAPTVSANSAAASGPAVESAKANTTAASASETSSAASPESPSTSAAQEPRTAPDHAVAKPRAAEAPRDADVKPRESDVRRDADTKPAVDKRKFERRRQWAERRRSPRRHDHELEAVEQAVREDTEPRSAFAFEPARIEMPRIKLFDPE